MAKDVSKLPVGKKEDERSVSSPRERHPFESFRREVDRLFDDFGRSWRSPFTRSLLDVEPFSRVQTSWYNAPAVDVLEKSDKYEITAELPGLDQSNIDINLSGDVLTIRGEKKEEKEETEKGYHLSERRFGSFQRSFRVPDGVDVNTVEASFKNGVLTLTLPKTPEAQSKAKKIEVKSG
jgi:HSP20 family protein